MRALAEPGGVPRRVWLLSEYRILSCACRRAGAALRKGARKKAPAAIRARRAGRVWRRAQAARAGCERWRRLAAFRGEIWGLLGESRTGDGAVGEHARSMPTGCTFRLQLMSTGTGVISHNAVCGPALGAAGSTGAPAFDSLGSVSNNTAHSLDDYLAIVQAFRKQWRVPKRDELWFRAEDATYRDTYLQPGIYRPRRPGKRRTIRHSLDLESDLYEEFERCATQLSQVVPGEDWEWEWYFLMQHHGVPTRLLDWSDGALIALHFAVRDKALAPASGSIVHVLHPYHLLKELERHSDRKDAIARWKQYSNSDPFRLDPDDWERLYLPAHEEGYGNALLATPQIPLLWDSPHVSRRVAAQRSRFMIFGTDPFWLANFAKRKDSTESDPNPRALDQRDKAATAGRWGS